jgi:antitoxin (DNA-binding transcriptional repressor) of toxin-antitoxin stability system
MSGVQIPHARLNKYTQHMQIYTVEEFQERWDEMITRVEGGEHIGITNGSNTCVMIPADEELIRIHTELNNEAP